MQTPEAGPSDDSGARGYSLQPVSLPLVDASAAATADSAESLRTNRFKRGAFGASPQGAGRLAAMPRAVPMAPEGVVAVVPEAIPGLRQGGPSTATAWKLLDRRAWPWLRAAVDLVLLALVTAIVLTEASASEPVGLLWIYPLLPIGMMAARGLYARRVWQSAVDVVFAAGSSVSIATMAYVTSIAFAGVEAELTLVAKTWILSLAMVCGAHATLLLARRWAQRTGRIGGRALIVGAGVVGRRVQQRLEQHPEFGLTPVGMLDAGPHAITSDAAPPLVGAPHEVVQTAKALQADHVILAFPRIPDGELVVHIRLCERAGLHVSVVPRLFESMSERFEIQRLGALPLLSLRRVDPRGWQFAVKYSLDRVLAVMVFVVILPVFALVACAVRLSSPGPTFFRQRRVGLDGRVFDLLKFRSMYVRPEPPEFRPAPGLAPGGVEGEDRRTPVGRFLRRSCLDELPQLINVIRGEMSLVGPRPERPEFVELFVEQVMRYDDRHRAKSGITGLAQVQGLRGQTSVADRIELDNHYIDNWSLALDLKILLLTIVAVFSTGSDN